MHVTASDLGMSFIFDAIVNVIGRIRFFVHKYILAYIMVYFPRYLCGIKIPESAEVTFESIQSHLYGTTGAIRWARTFAYDCY